MSNWNDIKGPGWSSSKGSAWTDNLKENGWSKIDKKQKPTSRKVIRKSGPKNN